MNITPSIIKVAAFALIVFGLAGAGSFHTSNSETFCANGQCQALLYPFTAFTQEPEGWKTVADITTLQWDGTAFVATHKDSWVKLIPEATIFSTDYTLQDLAITNPSIAQSKPVTTTRFAHKFGVRLENINILTATAISQMAFGIQYSKDLKPIADKESIRFDKFQISFEDLKEAGFTIQLEGTSRLVIGNISANIKGGILFLDPSITLDSANVSADYYNSIGTRPTRNSPRMRWQIDSVPSFSTILNASVCLNETTSTLTIMPDNDLNLTWIDNQTWAFPEWNSLYPYMTQSKITNWHNDTGSADVKKAMWWCANVTDYFLLDYNAANQYSSYSFIDPDSIGEPASSPISDSALKFGSSLALATFASSRNAITGQRPYMTVIYEAEANPPTVELAYPANNSHHYPPGTSMNLTCNIIDDTEIASVEWHSDFKNGTYMLHSTNTTSGIASANYTYTHNNTLWQDAGYYFGRSGTNWSSTTSISIAANSTHFFLMDYQDYEIYIINRSGFNESKITGLQAFAVDLGFNGTSFAIVSATTDYLYFYGIGGAFESSCSLQALGGNKNYYGVDFAPDGTLWVIDQSDDRIYHTNMTCGNLSSFEVGGNPVYLAIQNDVAIIHDTYVTPDQFQFWNLTTGSMMDYIVPLYVFYNGTEPAYGVAVNSEERSLPFDQLEYIYTDLSSPAVVTTAAFRRINGSMTWNCHACDIYGSCAWGGSNFTLNYGELPPDITYPLINLSDPLNQTYGYATLNLNHSEYDETGLSICWHNEDDGANVTLTCNVNTTFTSSEGRHTLNLYANDTSNNVNTTNINYTVDLTPPILTLNYPQNTTYNSSDVLLNYSVTDNFGLNVCWYELDGGINITLATCEEASMAGLAEGAHNVTMWANDTANNLAQSGIVWFTVDTIAPTVTIWEPLNASYNLTHTTINLSVTTSEPFNVTWYNLNYSGVNTSFIPNTTFIAGNGSNYLIVWANDSVGNVGYAEQWFDINFTLPEPMPTPIPANHTGLLGRPWFKEIIEDDEYTYWWPLSLLFCPIGR